MHVLLTAGPTYEPLDPVRFLGNRSTGKMGYALAEAFAAAGRRGDAGERPQPAARPRQPAHSHGAGGNGGRDVCGRRRSGAPRPMCGCLRRPWPTTGPAQVAAEKIKKSGETLTLELVKNVDIAATLGQTQAG